MRTRTDWLPRQPRAAGLSAQATDRISGHSTRVGAVHGVVLSERSTLTGADIQVGYAMLAGLLGKAPTFRPSSYRTRLVEPRGIEPLNS
jgi:hypothetical protein